MATIHEQLNILIELQDIEVKIRHTEHQIDALNAEAAALDDDYRVRTKAVQAEKEDLETTKKSYRDLESEAAINDEMIAKSNVKLREVSSNKEYQSILKEIAELEGKQSTLEDRMLALLEEIDAAEDAIGQQTAKLSRLTESSAAKKEDLTAKVKRRQARIDALNQKRAEIGGQADQKLLAILDKVKSKVRGMAVVPAAQEICTGCHMNIPAQLFNELQRFDELKFCPHCSRIIYWDEQEAKLRSE
jgi:predicted  nucleic acid-binding Zn-ribbon protein